MQIIGSARLGVDIGGTFTDVVLETGGDMFSTKVLTTYAAPENAIIDGMQQVCAKAGITPDDITQIIHGTTLATNALVEGQGGRVALIYIGFREKDLEAHGLADVLKGDPAIVLTGGHNHAGAQAYPLDEAGLIRFLETHKDCLLYTSDAADE